MPVRSGYSWGTPGSALNPAAVTQWLIFVSKGDQDQSFCLESLTVGGSPVDSDALSGVAFSADGTGDRLLPVDLVRAARPPPPALPDWLGRRPPVPGEWTQTLAEEFGGTPLDEARWSIHYPNHWDKRARFSRDNAILGDGVLRHRFERKRGHAEDDPARPETDYATGLLTSIGKWRQRPHRHRPARRPRAELRPRLAEARPGRGAGTVASARGSARPAGGYRPGAPAAAPWLPRQGREAVSRSLNAPAGRRPPAGS